MKHIVALSGGKDSTALALRLQEIEPRDYTFVCTPTGNELPEMIEHWMNLGKLLGKPLTPITCGQSLSGLIHRQQTLPNWRMRFCTRMLKIEPFQRFVLANLPATVYIGIRADETSREGVDYESMGDIVRRFPLVEWGWGIQDVLNYLSCRNVSIPARTDCAACFYQTLFEWYTLWKEYPDKFQEAENWEKMTGHTLRSSQRDSWPAGLRYLRACFEQGLIPKIKDVERTKMCSVCAR